MAEMTAGMTVIIGTFQAPITKTTPKGSYLTEEDPLPTPICKLKITNGGRQRLWSCPLVYIVEDVVELELNAAMGSYVNHNFTNSQVFV